jgi:L-lysine exporter family protein LysE/ArgO
MLRIFLEGFLLQASLIMALGAQNLFILESGIRRRHHLTASFVCFICDLILITLGVAGAATLFHKFPEIKVIVGILGVSFLFWYGFEKLTKSQSVVFEDEGCPIGLKDCILKAMTFSWLNPHAYLDGIVLIGGYSIKYAELSDRLILGLGASLCSLTWFLVLSTASSRLLPVFKSPVRLRWLMGGAGVCLIFLSARLSFDVYEWIDELFLQSATLTALP